jgi:hypothetical protein
VHRALLIRIIKVELLGDIPLKFARAPFAGGKRGALTSYKWSSLPVCAKGMRRMVGEARGEWKKTEVLDPLPKVFAETDF